MKDIKKVPDQKLRVGAMIGLISNIIIIVFSVIIGLILVINSSIIMSLIFIASNDYHIIITAVIIILLVTIIFSIAIIILCYNVLKGKATNGLVVGILILVLAGIGLISILSSRFAFVTGVDIIFLGLNIAAGVLLVMGKYETPIAGENSVTAI